MQEPDKIEAEGLSRRHVWGWYLLVSILALAPVFWQPRVQAGDLSSHIYNAWLTQLIETGRTQGLVSIHRNHVAGPLR